MTNLSVLKPRQLLARRFGVHLTDDQRDKLDQAAAAIGITPSEALRQLIDALPKAGPHE